jgi:hypothetical protein
VERSGDHRKTRRNTDAKYPAQTVVHITSCRFRMMMMTQLRDAQTNVTIQVPRQFLWVKGFYAIVGG